MSLPDLFNERDRRVANRPTHPQRARVSKHQGVSYFQEAPEIEKRHRPRVLSNRQRPAIRDDDAPADRPAPAEAGGMGIGSTTRLMRRFRWRAVRELVDAGAVWLSMSPPGTTVALAA